MSVSNVGAEVRFCISRIDASLRANLEPEAWRLLWHALGVVDVPWDAYRELVCSYSERHRAYHNLRHLAECLAIRRSIAAFTDAAHEIDVALWFHDAIYDPMASGNEEKSADWLDRVACRVGINETVKRRLRRLVLVTRHTERPESLDESILIDTDLAILGASEERFNEYDRQIREEFVHIPGFLYRRKRRAVLQTFLSRPQIYVHEDYAAVFELKARENLSRAIHALS